MSKKNLFIILILIIALILIKIPFINYPASGDAEIYAGTTESLATTGKYFFNGEPHNKYPPLFSMSSVPFFYLTKDPVRAIKYSNAFFGVATVLLLFIWMKKKGFNIKHSVIASLLLGINPFFFYFTTVFPLSEGLGIFLLTAGIFFYDFKNEKKINIYLSGAFFGLCIITRVVFGPFILPFLIYAAYKLIDIIKKDRLRHMVMNIVRSRYFHFIILTMTPLFLWNLRNIFVLDELASSAYIADNILPGFGSSVFFLPLYLIVVIPLTFLMITPFFYIKIYDLRKKNIFAKKLFYGIISYYMAIGFFTWDVWRFNIIVDGSLNIPALIVVSIAATRYTIPLLPIGILIAYKKWYQFSSKYKLIFVSLFILIIALLLFNSGEIQNAISSKVKIPETYVQRSAYRLQSIEWINNNAHEKASVLYNFLEPKSVDVLMSGLNKLAKYQFRKDLNVTYNLEETKKYPYAYYLIENCEKPDITVSIVKKFGNNKICIYR